MGRIKKIIQKISTGILSSMAAIALLVTSANVNINCWFIFGQDELPEQAKKLRKF